MNEETKGVVREASRLLTGFKRREFQAMITQRYFVGSPRKAERETGWGRECVKKGLKEAETGIRCADGFHMRGRKRTEEKLPGIEADIRFYADRETQADPAVKSSLTYTRITSASVRKALCGEKGYTDEELPSENTVGAMLNRMGYNLKRVLKAKPLKKIKQTDEIFENVWEINHESDNNPESLRISVDAKAKVHIGEFSRGGRSRNAEAERGADHDMNPKMKVVPYGILNVLTGFFTIFLGTSFETSDFIADCIEMWWERNRKFYSHIKELVINLDNGPNSGGGRTQFLRRMTEFSDKSGLSIRLVYYPPYHSKYNPVERCWGILEQHWNGELLNSVEKAVQWAGTMSWKGIRPVVHLWEKIYEKGVRLTKKEMKRFENRIKRSEKLPKWDIVIDPHGG